MSRFIERFSVAVLLGGMALLTCAGLAQTALTGPAPAAPPPAPSAPEYVRAGKLLDVRSGKMLDDQVIVIRGGRIERIGPASEAQIPTGARLIDCPGRQSFPA